MRIHYRPSMPARHLIQLHQALVLTLALCVVSSPALGDEASLPKKSETNLLKKLQEWERNKTDTDDALGDARFEVRSRHFVFGMPRLVDDRHNLQPEGFSRSVAGISIVVREGFVIAHFDRMKTPLWVAQLWTKNDYNRMNEVASQKRRWREDLDLPIYARGGTSYDGNKTKLDRGHMARHAMNRAWGIDVSNWGCKMSNSAPQHKRINRLNSAWQKLEDEIRDIVVDEDASINGVWTISGTVYRDKTNPDSEAPEDDFDDVVRLPKGGFGIPDATYKIVGWFDENARFQARAYVFEQPHTATVSGNNINLDYSLGNPQAALTTFLVSIVDLEARTGIDFFPMLRDNVENLIEGSAHDDLWGAE